MQDMASAEAWKRDQVGQFLSLKPWEHAPFALTSQPLCVTLSAIPACHNRFWLCAFRVIFCRVPRWILQRGAPRPGPNQMGQAFHLRPRRILATTNEQPA